MRLRAGQRTGELLGLARLLGTPDGEVREALAGRINPSDVLWRQLEARRGWVLIFDNADNPGALAVGQTEQRAGERDGCGRPRRSWCW